MDKVVIHSYSKGAFRGGSGKYTHFEVVTGANPFGPRGGLSGKYVDGVMRKHFWKREKADEYAKHLALEEGLVYLSSYEPDDSAVLKPKLNFDINSIIDDREKTLKHTHVRKGQKAFRSQVKEAFNGRCAITGCDVPQALQACHIYSYLGEATNHPSNGLLLRADLHGLFDSYLIAVSDKGRLLLSSELSESTYKKYRNIKVTLPFSKFHEVSKPALEFHRDMYKKAEKVRKANKSKHSDAAS